MKKYLLMVICTSIIIIASCGTNGANHGDSAPIDSSNVYGAAPAKYGGNDPAKDTNNRSNLNDTGTNAANVHNAGTR